MDKIKKSFQNVKKDIFDIKKELSSLKDIFKESKEKINYLMCNLEKTIKIQSDMSKIMTEKLDLIKTDKQKTQTNEEDNSTNKTLFKPLNDQNKHISIGNQGVSTDRQTDRQTDRHMNLKEISQKDTIKEAVDLLESLDSLKKELRIKFKRLTHQEFLVFSIIYQLTEDKGYATYQDIAYKLNLTESSIRDYVGRLLKKEISIDKIKLNNKNIHLKISENLIKIATLPTILQLRDL